MYVRLGKQHAVDNVNDAVVGCDVALDHANGAHRGPSDVARRRPVLTSLDEHGGFQ
jgi:hypothetical protein